MTVEVFLDKARHSLRAANLLFEAEEYEATSNRAYYAMFNAARCALLALGEEQSAFSKTHSGLISEFGAKVANAGHVPGKWGRVLSRESTRRLLADYEGLMIEAKHAKEAIANATEFLAVIAALVETLSK